MAVEAEEDSRPWMDNALYRTPGTGDNGHNSGRCPNLLLLGGSDCQTAPVAIDVTELSTFTVCTEAASVPPLCLPVQ